MINGKKILGLIPARGGSKRLPDKNLLPLADKPLIAWSIEAALSSGFIDKVIVTTDSNKISEVADKYGADVPFLRPEYLSTDTANTLDVIHHALQQVEEVFEYLMLLQPTSPLRSKNDIDNVCRILSTDASSVISVCVSEHSPLWMNTLPSNHSMDAFLDSKTAMKRSQDLPKYYRLNGAIFASKIEYLVQNNGFYGNSTMAYIMPQERSVDIDTKLDLNICECIIASQSTN